MEGRYVSLEEAAKYCGLTLPYIYRLSSEGKLPGKIKFGQRTVRVDLDVLQAWLDAKAVNPLKV